MSSQYPKCHACHWCRYKQCEHEWVDYHGGLSPTKKRVVVLSVAHEDFPAHHVWQFYCQGKGFKSNGSGEQ